MGYRCIRTYEVTFVLKTGEQTYDHVKATSRTEAKRAVEHRPEVERVIGDPHCKGY
jgi:hypothetical protein